ncbi:uncharacterized protein LOC114308827 isoform X3 [Camellia sinensis]|uniref:uncharacterized protein LOC114308827 isoform X3 n=1 Tax=Camellia sinensis TaxID=4442 RepID=UPI00103560C3|nr:uncharacterized protein LOC114308827 isoform X3 [Camellia sinensis]
MPPLTRVCAGDGADVPATGGAVLVAKLDAGGVAPVVHMASLPVILTVITYWWPNDTSHQIPFEHWRSVPVGYVDDLFELVDSLVHMVQRREALLACHCHQAQRLDGHFGWHRKEMCPTLEEFQALMESRRNEEIMPQPLFGHTRALEQMCGLSFNEAKSLAHDGELDIPSLIRRFSGIRNRRDLLWQGYRQHALCLCLLAHYLLAPSVSGVSIRLIEVAQRLKEGRSCIGLALAETLMGLDAFHWRETFWFAGSPLLLQVWLMDKLKVVDPCSECSVRSYFFCSQLVSFPTEGFVSYVRCRVCVIVLSSPAPRTKVFFGLTCAQWFFNIFVGFLGKPIAAGIKMIGVDT